MDQVGYDTYCRLLDVVVKEMTGEDIQKDEEDIQIDVNVSAFIPDNFIEQNNQKIEIYQNIALCESEENIFDVTDEIIDRYGKMPIEVENLLKVASIKILSKKLGIIKVVQKNDKMLFTFDKDKFNIDIEKIIEKYKNKVMFSAGVLPYFTYKLDNTENILNEVKIFLEDNK